MQAFRTTFGDQELKLNWSNIDNLRTYSAHQLGRYYFNPEMDNNTFFNIFNQKVELNWKRIIQNVDTSKFKRVVDVGCGIAVPDCLLSKHNPDIEFYLVDKSEISHTGSGKYYEPKHGHYNSWDVLEDCIKTSGLNRDKFNLLNPESAWPDNVDFIISTYSWCWHYPKETYWSKVQSSLNIGGTLALDIINLPDRDVAEEISEEFKSNPIYIPTRLPNSKFADQFTLKDGAMGGFYIWKRNA